MPRRKRTPEIEPCNVVKLQLLRQAGDTGYWFVATEKEAIELLEGIVSNSIKGQIRTCLRELGVLPDKVLEASILS